MNYRKKSTVQNSIFVLLTLQCSSIKSISPENIESKLNNKSVLPRYDPFFFFFGKPAAVTMKIHSVPDYYV